MRALKAISTSITSEKPSNRLDAKAILSDKTADFSCLNERAMDLLLAEQHRPIVTSHRLGVSTPSHPKLRKRTKTGCLTCRKRRIKCGEERPACANCMKFKRHCEGYNHRVVFRAPIVQSLSFHSAQLPHRSSIESWRERIPNVVSAKPLFGIPIDEYVNYGLERWLGRC
jgi:hypothetical protein